ncbi:sugar transferase [Tolypothrix sp. PCC 7910]|uniref:sugar transferase n=1 Tax=Tolypothrix sp. PCC 7910 TaxID=2099387 RepID=UPI0014279B7B|nr:sugar transferase [Tolypothrix sp. PCC 7910]QIR37962.1 sugar transferase [Tolypothrix sp. PCC 7910]
MPKSSNSQPIDIPVVNSAYISHVAQLPIHPSVNSKAKRIIDILGAVIGLGIMVIILIPVAIAIRLDNPGPIFYSQIRCGLNGRSFRIWKFRSMVVGAEKLKHLVNNEAQNKRIFKNENDPRITRVGKLLRRTSLDELPQFWNVLLGEMSLVGTRPPTPDEVMHYSNHHWQRLNVKPGMTGEWQANGRSQIKDFEDIFNMDINYQRKWSIAYDIILIIKTLKVVFKKDGAF